MCHWLGKVEGEARLLILFTKVLIKLNEINNFSKKSNAMQMCTYFILETEIHFIISVQAAGIIPNYPRRGIWRLHEIKKTENQV